MIHLFAATEEVEGIAALGIDPWAILAQGTTFLVLFILVKKFALEKIVSVLQERHKKIDSGVRLGYKMEKEMADLEKRIAEKMHEARQDADKVIEQAQKEAAELLEEAEERAQAKVHKMFSDAEAKIASDIANAQDELTREVVNLVAEATETVLREKLDQRTDMRLIERSIAEVTK